MILELLGGRIILLITLLIIQALSHPYLTFQPNPIVEIKVIKRYFIPTDTRYLPSQDLADDKQDTDGNKYVGESSMYEVTSLPFVSFFGITILLYQILEDVAL